MKDLFAIRMGILLFGTSAVLLLAPASKAQFEISPDHFDGTDSWEMTAQTLHAEKHTRSGAKSHLHGQNQRTVGGSTFEPAGARENSKAAAQDAAAVDPKRMQATNIRQEVKDTGETATGRGVHRRSQAVRSCNQRFHLASCEDGRHIPNGGNGEEKSALCFSARSAGLCGSERRL